MKKRILKSTAAMLFLALSGVMAATPVLAEPGVIVSYFPAEGRGWVLTGNGQGMPFRKGEAEIRNCGDNLEKLYISYAPAEIYAEGNRVLEITCD
ncbi:MAG: hypothetical protein BroJett030_31760 [Alphaproteobacteria bacterium]|nr:MAG: hypothetical protein BroJett030_31760 [Alphaproteobacteria bacterium]